MKSSRSTAAARPPDFDDLLPAEADAASRRALALLWLADSTPLTAAPADALTTIRSRLSLAGAPARRHSWRALAIAGWAAAACFAALLWRRPAGNSSALPDKKPADEITHGKPAVVPRPDTTVAPAPGEGTVQPFTDAGDLRRQLTELRAALDASRQSEPGTHRPVIRELRPPGSTAPAASHDRILDLLAVALESDLRRRAGPGDGRELIIESGWANWSAGLPADTTFRHRQFPKDRWAELGLLQSAGGQFLDPATGWLWSPDPDSTDYTGRVAPAGLDRAHFAGPDKPAPERAPVPATPAGYLLTGADGQTIVALNGLPAIPRGSSLSMTTTGVNGDPVNYNLAGSTLTTDGWNFSGIIHETVNVSLESGFSVLLHDAHGGSSVILDTGDSQQR